MGEAEVAAVFGPEWVRTRVANCERDLRATEKIILALRRKLIEFDSSLPNEYDGKAWSKIEAIDG